MQTITINKPISLEKTETKELSSLLTSILSEYNTFDIKLMQKYYQTNTLDDSNFTNI